MNKHEAHCRIDRGDLTWGQLRTMLQKATVTDAINPGRRRSVVNAGLTKAQVLDILSKGIDDRKDLAVVNPHNNRDVLTATNILRECGVVES